MMTDPRLILDMSCAAGQLWPLVSFFQTHDGFTMVSHLVPLSQFDTLLALNPTAIVFDHSRSCVTPLS